MHQKISKPSIALSYYPLPQALLDALSEIDGAPVENLCLSSIHAASIAGTLRILRQRRFATLYIPTPGPDWQPFEPMVRVLALAMHADRRVCVRRDLSLAAEPVWRAGLAAVALALRWVAAWPSVARYAVQVNRLDRLSRHTPDADPEADEVLYIKANLGTGVIAGGSVAHTAGVVAGLLRAGRRVRFVAPGEGRNIAAGERLMTERVPLPGGYVYPREINIFRYDGILGRFLGRVRRGATAFIYHRMSLGSVAAVAAARRMGVPLVLEYNGSEVWISKHWGTPVRFAALIEKAEAACLKHAHLIVAVSEPLRQELLARGVEDERILVQPNGFDPALFDPGQFGPAERMAERRRLDIADDSVLATFVGSFGPWHGAEVFAQAIIELAKTPTPIRFLFVGDGANRAAVQQMLDASGCLHLCRFTGLVAPERTPLLLAASDICVSPHVPNTDGSMFFGSPTKLFEYMAMGRPVIASALGQIADVMTGAQRWTDSAAEVPDDKANGTASQIAAGPGLLVPPRNAMALAGALRFAAGHAEWRAQAGARARAVAVERHSWPRAVATVMAALDARHPAPAAQPKRAVRVLINAIHAKSGGGLTYLRNVLPLLGRRDDIAVDLVIQSDQAEGIGAIPDTCRVHMLPTRGRAATVLWQEQVGVPLLARRVQADVIFSPANYGPLWGRPAVILMRNSLAVGRIEERFSKRLYWWALGALSWAAFRRCRAAIAVSRHALAEFLSAFHTTADPRTDVVHHGLSAAFIPAGAARRSRGLLLAVSDIYVQKNLGTLIQAVALLAPAHPAIRLEIAGRELDPGHAQDLRDLCVRLGIAERITFLGGLERARLVERYSVADVFVFPSLVETFGNPVLEAMASGVPVVCSDASAIPEIAGGAALLARPSDAGDFARQIARLLDDRALWQAQADRGLERAQQFSWSATVEATVRVLRIATRPG